MHINLGDAARALGRDMRFPPDLLAPDLLALALRVA